MTKQEEVPLRIIVDADLKYQFRVKTMQNKTDMKTEITKFMQKYINK